LLAMWIDPAKHIAKKSTYTAATLLTSGEFSFLIASLIGLHNIPKEHHFHAGSKSPIHITGD
jgi:hypothetical protein